MPASPCWPPLPQHLNQHRGSCRPGSRRLRPARTYKLPTSNATRLGAQALQVLIAKRQQSRMSPSVDQEMVHELIRRAPGGDRHPSSGGGLAPYLPPCKQGLGPHLRKPSGRVAAATSFASVIRGSATLPKGAWCLPQLGRARRFAATVQCCRHYTKNGRSARLRSNGKRTSRTPTLQ